MCAPLFLALVDFRSCLAQASVADPSLPAPLTLAAALPDAPSFSSSEQQAPTPPLPVTPQSPAAPAAPQNETEAQRKAREAQAERDEAEREVKTQEKQRAVGGVLPLFNVVMNGRAVPLTPGEKFNLSLHTIIDPYTIGLAFVVGGGFGELTDSHTGYGHGPSGFFKRVGASYADNIDGNLIGNALLPVILHQDPRYFRKGTGSVKSRIIYSALTTFICHGDNGRLQFNTSNVAGNFISGAISNLYYPADERGVGLTLENGLVVTLEGMAGAQILEFTPDLTAYLHRRRERRQQALQKQNAPAATPGAAPAGVTPADGSPPSSTVPPATPPLN